MKDRNKITLALADRRGKPMDASVTFSRQWSEDAEWFLRLQRTEQDTQLLSGVRVRF